MTKEAVEKQLEQLANSLQDIDPGKLTRMEVYGEPDVQEIAMFVPVTLTGERDESRPLHFKTDITMRNVNGQAEKLIIGFEADSLEHALKIWRRHAAEAAMAFLQEQRNAAASRLLMREESESSSRN